MDPRERFTSTVDDYRRHRPDYPEALFDDWIAREGLREGDTVVEVGCGTGIAARQIAARGLRVVGVDPNVAMLEAARAEGGDVVYLRGDAETLPVAGPVDAIVGGQSFHWIDLDRALPRFRKILRPGGRVMAFWNLRDGRDAFMAAYESLLLERCPEYAEVGAEPRARAVAAHPGLRDPVETEHPHAQELDRQGFSGRVWSSSYVRSSVKDRAAFDQALDALFDAHAVGGRVRFAYRTWAITFG